MRLDQAELACLLQGKEPTMQEVARVTAQFKKNGRKPKLVGDDYVKAIKLKHIGYSGERISRILRGIVTANHINTLYREAKRDIMLESNQELDILN